MCGIAGFILSPLDADAPTDLMIRDMGLEIENRGSHATGVARLSPNGRIKVSKAPVTAARFFQQREKIGSNARAALIHTRFWTQGPPEINDNNHPITSGKIIGVHNGTISNDYRLFTKYGWDRRGTVDSEAIFAAIHNLGTKPGLEAIEGGAAVAWFDLEDLSTLHLARQFTFPLVVGMTANGSLLFGSSDKAVEAGAWYLPGDNDSLVLETVPEETYLAYNGQEMEFTAYDKFEAAEDWSSYRSGTYSFGTGKSYTVSSEKSGYTLSEVKEVATPTDFTVGDKVWFKPHGFGETIEPGSFRYGMLPAVVTTPGRLITTIALSLDRWTVVDDVTCPTENLTARDMLIDGLDKFFDLPDPDPSERVDDLRYLTEDEQDRLFEADVDYPDGEWVNNTDGECVGYLLDDPFWDVDEAIEEKQRAELVRIVADWNNGEREARQEVLGLEVPD